MDDGITIPAMEPTTCLTNTPAMETVLHRRCDRSRQHGQLIGRDEINRNARTRLAQVHPEGLCTAIAKGIRIQTSWSNPGVRLLAVLAMHGECRGKLNINIRCGTCSGAQRSCGIWHGRLLASIEEGMPDGIGPIPQEDEAFHSEDDTGAELFAWDDVDGQAQHIENVQAARREEIKFYQHMGTDKEVDIAECWTVTAKAPVKVKWADHSKGDSLNGV